MLRSAASSDAVQASVPVELRVLFLGGERFRPFRVVNIIDEARRLSHGRDLSRPGLWQSFGPAFQRRTQFAQPYCPWYLLFRFVACSCEQTQLPGENGAVHLFVVFGFPFPE
jgi:hypothetical protein